MRKMEYTIKVVTAVPIDTKEFAVRTALVTAMTDIKGVESAFVTNWRVVPAKKGESK